MSLQRGRTEMNLYSSEYFSKKENESTVFFISSPVNKSLISKYYPEYCFNEVFKIFN